jgi:transcription antitermination factor NusA-like protein
MVKYILYLLLAFLVIDHVWTHFGPKIINSIASELAGKETKVVEESQDRKSILDNTLDKLVELKEKLSRR